MMSEVNRESFMKTVNSKNFLTRKIVANGKHQMVTFQNCEDFFVENPVSVLL